METLTYVYIMHSRYNIYLYSRYNIHSYICCIFLPHHNYSISFIDQRSSTSIRRTSIVLRHNYNIIGIIINPSNLMWTKRSECKQPRPWCSCRTCRGRGRAGRTHSPPTAFPTSSWWSSRACTRTSARSSPLTRTRPATRRGSATACRRSTGTTLPRCTFAWTPRSIPLRSIKFTDTLSIKRDYEHRLVVQALLALMSCKNGMKKKKQNK